MTDRAEALLVLRAQTGDLDALGELLVIVQSALRGYLCVLTRDEARADDVLQETFLIAVRKLRTLRDADLFRPWLFRIATREAYRGRRVEEVPFEEAPETASRDDLDGQLMADEARGRIRQAVLRLPDRAREAVTLHYLHEMPFEQVAAVLDIPVGTVKSRVAYGLARLRTRQP